MDNELENLKKLNNQLIKTIEKLLNCFCSSEADKYKARHEARNFLNKLKEEKNVS